MERLFHSSGGMDASLRSITASFVETIWITAERPSVRSARIDAASVGAFNPARRWPKKRSLAPSNAEWTAEAARPLLALPSSSLKPVAFSASPRLAWISWKASAQASQMLMSSSVRAWKSGSYSTPSNDNDRAT